MSSYILLFLASLLESWFIFTAISVILRAKIPKYYIEKIILAIIIYLKTLVSYHTGSFYLLGMMLIIICIYIIIKELSNEKFLSNLKVLVTIYMVFIIGEICVSLIAMILNYRFDNLSLTERAIFSIISICIYYFLLKIFRIRLYHHTFIKKHHSLWSYLVIITLFFISLIVCIYLNARFEEYHLLLVLLIFMQIILLLLSIIINSNKNNYRALNNKLTKENDVLFNLLKEEKKRTHEYINDLLILKTNLSSKEQINALINKYNYKSDEKIVNELMPLNEPLKTILNTKTKLMREHNIQYTLSYNVEKMLISQSRFRTVSKIVAILLDNAIEASVDKQKSFVGISFYETDKSYKIEVFNWFKNGEPKIKGKGSGLNIIKELIKEDFNLGLNTFINDNYYTQHLEIKKPLI